LYFYFHNFGSFVFSFEVFLLKKMGPNNASKTAPSHCAHCLFSCAVPHNIHNSFL
jgi:hypothetical protein